MQTHRTKSVGLVIALLLLFVVGANGLRPNSSIRATAADSNDSQLKQLLQERYAVLRSIAS